MTIVIFLPRMINPDMATEYLGGQLIFQDLVKKSS
jgi:hypothetical protein